MGEREEESGRTWPAALTLMEDGERRGASAVMRATYVTAIKKRELERQISIYITVLHEQKCYLKFLCRGKLEGALMSRTAASSCKNVPVEVVWASDQEVSWTHPIRGLRGMSHWKQIPNQGRTGNEKWSWTF